MAVETQGERIPQLAAADLRALEQRFMINSGADHTINKATGATVPILGVCTRGANTGDHAALQIVGMARVTAGAAVAVGDKVTSDANGKAVTVASAVGAKYVGGIALEAAGADGEEISVLLTPGACVNTAVS